METESVYKQALLMQRQTGARHGQEGKEGEEEDEVRHGDQEGRQEGVQAQVDCLYLIEQRLLD